jgi:hypothetical protein
VNYDIAEKYGWLPEVVKNEIEDDRVKRPILYRQKWLGEPFISPNDLIKEDSLIKCLSPLVNSQEGRVVIGVDTGHNIYYTMMNKEGIFYHGYCASVEEMGGDPTYDPYDEIARRMNQYPKSILVADQGGDLIGIRKLQAKFPSRVYLCWFTKESKHKELIRWGEKDEYGKVLVDRNRTIQLVVDQIREKRLTFNGVHEEWKPFFAHAMNIYRVKEIQGQDENDPQYGWRWVWKRKGPDHWFMSMIYGLVGMDKFAESKATIVGADTVFTGMETGRIFDNSQNLWN